MRKRTFKLMTHIVAGYPTLEESYRIAETMIKAGVDRLEIQIPFTDPIADGYVISTANHEALDQGVQLKDCFELMKKIRAKTNIPLYFMIYGNIPFKYGFYIFCQQAQKAGANGLIIPDLPYDQIQGKKYLESCAKTNLNPIQVISPLTSVDRLKEIGIFAQDFVYCVAGSGTTGKARTITNEVKEYLTRVRKYIDIPLALGFGISTKKEIQKAGKFAEIVVIGSQTIRLYQDGSKNQKLKNIYSFLS